MRSIMANSKSIITITVQPKLSGEMEFMWHRFWQRFLVSFIHKIRCHGRENITRELMVLPAQAISMNY